MSMLHYFFQANVVALPQKKHREFYGVLLFSIALFSGAKIWSNPEIGKRIKAPDKPVVTKWLLGAGGNTSFFSENAITVNYTSTYIVSGFQVNLLREQNNLWYTFDAGLSWMNKLLVNQIEIEMEKRSQIFVPLRGAVYFPMDSSIGLGGGLAGIIETEMKYRGESTPNSSSFQAYIFGGMYVRFALADKWELFVNPVLGINPVPGRTKRTNISKLIHLNLNFSAGIVYRLGA